MGDLVAALNAGLAARAPFARMDADDMAHAERLERQARRLDEDARVDLVGCRVVVDPSASAGRSKRTVAVSPASSRDWLWNSCDLLPF
jgi:hypothetical protein